MKIQICGLGHLGSVGDPEVATSVPVMSFYHNGEKELFKKKAWEVLSLAGIADDSVVEIVTSETTDKNGNAMPYVVVTYEEGVETLSQIDTVVRYFTETIGLDVEVPRPINFYRRKK